MFKSESSMNFTMKFCEFVIHSDFIFLLLAAVTAQKPLTRQPSSSVELNPLDSGVSSLVGEKQFVCFVSILFSKFSNGSNDNGNGDNYGNHGVDTGNVDTKYG